MTRVQPPAVTAAQIVGWLTETEANEIRRMVGWDVTAVQMRIFEEVMPGKPE